MMNEVATAFQSSTTKVIDLKSMFKKEVQSTFGKNVYRNIPYRRFKS